MSSTSALPATGLWAGAVTADLTPPSSTFLFGYPHVPRMSTGVHDPLEAAVLHLREGDHQVIWVATDLIFVGRPQVREIRRQLHLRTGVPPHAIAITATHTHSGPVMVDCMSNEADPVVPKADPAYLELVTRRIVEAGCAAVRSAVPAELGLAVANAQGVGTNRHDPAGPADPSVPVLLVRSQAQSQVLACMVAYAMHPTVLHEDSTLISGDFPFFTRQFLRQHGIVPAGCPVLYHNGASGNQSPRHVTKGNTFAEAQRLGELLGAAIAAVVPKITFSSTPGLKARRAELPLQTRSMPPVDVALEGSRRARARFEGLQRENAPRTAVRTAECDWFGAEETVALAQAAADGRLQKAAAESSPAEIQVIEVGPWKFVHWPGEFFVEYALEVKAAVPGTFVITLANGELQGYIVTPEAVTRGVYEAGNALFSADNGQRVVAATLDLLRAKG
jgi:neutral ceramidase